MEMYVPSLQHLNSSGLIPRKGLGVLDKRSSISLCLVNHTSFPQTNFPQHNVFTHLAGSHINLLKKKMKVQLVQN